MVDLNGIVDDSLDDVFWTVLLRYDWRCNVEWNFPIIWG